MTTPRRPRRGSITAAELPAELESDPEFQRRAREKELFQRRRLERNERDEAPILAELRQAGLTVNGISDLFNYGLDYRRAISALLKWLPKVHNLDVKEGIVRALSVSWARPAAAPLLIEEYRRAPDQPPGFKWAVGNALGVVADDSCFEEIAELARDTRHGKARDRLLAALGTIRRPEAIEVLIELLDDEDMALWAARVLGQKHVDRARAKIQELVDHAEPAVRAQATRSLAMIDRPRERREAAHKPKPQCLRGEKPHQ